MTQSVSTNFGPHFAPSPAPVAQWIERRFPKPQVPCSIHAGVAMALVGVKAHRHNAGSRAQFLSDTISDWLVQTFRRGSPSPEQSTHGASKSLHRQ